jgi:hypothetical protein
MIRDAGCKIQGSVFKSRYSGCRVQGVHDSGFRI